jgi:nucleotide-binding universal stress UspA family protein
MYKIVVPLDGSVLAEGALPCAEELGGRLKAAVDLVGVAISKSDKHRHIFQGYLDNTAETTRRRISDNYIIPMDEVKISSVMLFGRPSDEIIDYSTKKDADLIIMTTHGLSGIERFMLGGSASAVIRESHIPVLIIRTKHGKPDVIPKDVCTKVVIPLDGSKPAEAALEVARKFLGDLSEHYPVEVRLVHVVQPLPHQERMAEFAGRNLYDITDKNIHRLDQQIKDRVKTARDYLCNTGKNLATKGMRVDCAVLTGRPADEIVKYADEIGANTILMSTHGLTSTSLWDLGSVSTQILSIGHAALMLVYPFGKKPERRT